MMITLSGTLVKTLLAIGGVCLLALVVVLVAMSGRDSVEAELLADTGPGHEVEVLVGEGPVTVYVSGAGSGDPRPDGEPDPGMCTASGDGDPSLGEPDIAATSTIGETTLYPVAQVESYTPPMGIACSGGDIDHVYVMGPS